MKIIGKGWDDHFIVEIEKSELRKLTGYYYNRMGCPDYSVGTTIRVSDIFNQLNELSRHEDFLKDTARQLRALADLLLLFDPIIKPEEQEKGEPE